MDRLLHTSYKLADGRLVPGVTTILGILEKPPLIHWAWECGIRGLDYREIRDQAGDTGKLVHYIICCRLQNKEPDLSGYTPQEIHATATSMKQFDRWYKQHTLEPLLLETPLVSELYGYGGTPDCYGKLDGLLTLLDFKTGNEIYLEAFHQAATYWELLIENKYEVEQAKIIHLPKTTKRKVEYPLQNRQKHWHIFLCCRLIYTMRKELEGSK